MLRHVVVAEVGILRLVSVIFNLIGLVILLVLFLVVVGIEKMLSWAPPASLHFLDASRPDSYEFTDSSELARRLEDNTVTLECPAGWAQVRTGLVALIFPERPTGLLGILPPRPLIPSGAFAGSAASFAALLTLRVFFPRVGGWSAPAATSGSFWTLRLSPLRRPSRFELILGFGGDTLADLFPPDIPEPFAAFLRPVPTIFGVTITSFELVATMVLFTWIGWFADSS
jgi:hypothetical protein